jgi:hypothetical protein
MSQSRLASLNREIARNPTARLVFRTGLAVLLTIPICLLYLQGSHLDDPLLNIVDLAYGRSPTPYVYRVLLPYSARLIAALTPLSIEAAAAGLLYLFLLGFVFAFQAFLTAFVRRNSPYIDVLPLFAVLGFVLFLFGVRQPYDLPVLCLFTLALTCLIFRRWWWLLLVYLLACLTKETTILLTPFYLLYFYRARDQFPYYRLLVAQLLIYLSIRSFLFW